MESERECGELVRKQKEYGRQSQGSPGRSSLARRTLQPESAKKARPESLAHHDDQPSVDSLCRSNRVDIFKSPVSACLVLLVAVHQNRHCFRRRRPLPLDPVHIASVIGVYNSAAQKAWWIECLATTSYLISEISCPSTARRTPPRACLPPRPTAPAQ